MPIVTRGLVHRLEPMVRVGVFSTVLALAFAATGCTRERPGLEPPLERAAAFTPTAMRRSQPFVLTEPKVGAAVHSPVTVRVNAADVAPLLLAAQAQSKTSGTPATLEWRGNTTLAKAADGAFVGQITYQLAADQDGLIEVALVDPASGTVIESMSVPVRLQASP